jgi:hypothetical protein
MIKSREISQRNVFKDSQIHEVIKEEEPSDENEENKDSKQIHLYHREEQTSHAFFPLI